MTTVTWQYPQARDCVRSHADSGPWRKRDGRVEKCNSRVGRAWLWLLQIWKHARTAPLYHVTSVTFTAFCPRFTIHLVVWQFWGRAAVASWT